MKTRSKDNGTDGHSGATGSTVVLFDRLYRDHVDRIYRLAQRLCGHSDDARDLVQETFLNAFRKFKQFRGEAQVSTWLYTIASRACLRMRRRRKGEPERELSLEEFIPTSEGEFRLQIATQRLTPEQALEKKRAPKGPEHCNPEAPQEVPSRSRPQGYGGVVCQRGRDCGGPVGTGGEVAPPPGAAVRAQGIERTRGTGRARQRLNPGSLARSEYANPVP